MPHNASNPIEGAEPARGPFFEEANKRKFAMSESKTVKNREKTERRRREKLVGRGIGWTQLLLFEEHNGQFVPKIHPKGR